MSDLRDRPTEGDLSALRDEALQQQVRALSEDRRVSDAGRDKRIDALSVAVEALTNQMAEMLVTQHNLVRQMAEREKVVDKISEALSENTTMTAGVKEMLSTVTALKGGIKVLGWLGVGVKWVTLVGAPIYVFIYAITHGGKLPHQP